MKHKKLKIVYRNNKPHGIRDENGYLLYFMEISKYPGQEERYKAEVNEQILFGELYTQGSKTKRGLKCRSVKTRNAKSRLNLSDAVRSIAAKNAETE